MKLVSLPTVKLPSISRFITELSVKKWVFGVLVGISLLLSVLIVLKFFDLGRSVLIMRVATVQKEATIKELQYWEDVIGRYPDYRDAYYKAYLLSTRLSDREKAQRYAHEILRIDPLFELPSEE